MAQVVADLESILALHEKTNKTLLPMDTKIFGIKVPAFGISSSNENSFVGSISKSLESYLYTVGGENRILRQFDFKTINIATEKFSRSNAISRSLVYGLMHKDPTTIERQISGLQAAPPLVKGKLENGQDITVVGPYPHEQYDCCTNQVSILVKVEHPNLAQLSGWCIEQSNVYLIYDIPHNYATLEHVLHDHNRVPFDWDERYKILLVVARVLLYLHKHAPIRVLYCDVKARNILLDEGLNPKLHGFYFAVSTAINETDCIDNNNIFGTKGILAPEYAMHGHLSTKTDVFDFGMLVLETISGCSVPFYRIKSAEMFPDYDYKWINLVDGTYSNIIDSRISYDSGSIKRFIHIGLWCIQTEATNRPTMEDVVGMVLDITSIHLPSSYTSFMC
ncbi:cysteine-rich receptor-like protein kinase 44 [Bidens hawaiensis]|uniref:cysteine-rich receptor-like protein kinase 44 n=1 Tax=Bidens hawaiensis TaxID=980011 RepID=UPI00404A3DD9